MGAAGRRMGVYIDAVHKRVEREGSSRYATDPADFAFVGVFLPEVAKQFDSLTLFGRTITDVDVGSFGWLPEDVRVLELPYYADLRSLRRVAAVAVGTAARFWRGLDDLDVVWIFGPHPFGLLLAGIAFARRKRIALGVRQDTLAYFRSRLPSKRWVPALLPARGLDAAYRLLARRVPTVVTGPEIARRYGGESRGVLAMIESVVRRDELPAAARTEAWSAPVELLTVGRLDAEKNPLLLVDAIARLERERPGRFRLTWIGGGPMEDEIRERAASLGISSAIALEGWVAFGPALLELYKRANAFVHVSLTEGVPKVIVEALATGLPIVATDVGGVRWIVDDGRAAALVPPADLDALVAEILRLDDDGSHRRALAERALTLGRRLVLEEQAYRVGQFLASSAGIPGTRD